ncbi:hypothetical protein D3C76_751030 [compost metagenome]
MVFSLPFSAITLIWLAWETTDSCCGAAKAALAARAERVKPSTRVRFMVWLLEEWGSSLNTEPLSVLDYRFKNDAWR